jgi:predicted Rossmann-fold nucleotide-binding protein
MDEFFEVLTWAQLKLHSRPIIVANIAGYWQPMLDLIDHIIASGFADPSMRDLFSVAQTVVEVETTLRSALNTATV